MLQLAVSERSTLKTRKINATHNFKRKLFVARMALQTKTNILLIITERS